MTTRDALARHLFERQATDYGAYPGEADSVWANDADVRAFWQAEATAVLMFLNLAVDPAIERCTACNMTTVYCESGRDVLRPCCGRCSH